MRRTQAERKLQSEAVLLEAAIAIVARQGVGALTFEMLARAAGVSRGLPTHRFGTKDRLIESLLELLRARQKERLAAMGIDEMSGGEAICSYLELSISNLSGNPEGVAFFRLLWATLSQRGPLARAFVESIDDVRGMLICWSAKGRADGSVRADLNDEAIASMISSLIVDAFTRHALEPKFDLDMLLRRDLNFVRAVLKSQRPRAYIE